jgi:hypothetical protein
MPTQESEEKDEARKMGRNILPTTGTKENDLELKKPID